MHLGICGYAESGKDEVADILVRDFGFVKIGMSDALDKYLQILDPYVDAELNGMYDPDIDFIRYSEIRSKLSYVEAKQIPEVRRLLQVLGTDVGRAIDSDMWIKELKKSASEHKNVVTTGIRFQNEVNLVDRLLWVDRKGVGPKNDHVSEDLRYIFRQATVTIYNYGTIEQLHHSSRDFGEWYCNHSYMERPKANG